MKYVIVSGGLKALKNRSISVFEYMLSNKMNLDLDYYLKKQVIPPMQRVLSSLANLDEWSASLDVKQTEENKNTNEIQLNKKCLRCKGEAYFVLCERCMSFTQEEIDRMEEQKQECINICKDCIGEGNAGDGGKCVEWNCENLWMRKKITKSCDGTIPELIRLKEALQTLHF